jgi:hypothetical protein
MITLPRRLYSNIKVLGIEILYYYISLRFFYLGLRFDDLRILKIPDQANDPDNLRLSVVSGTARKPSRCRP